MNSANRRLLLLGVGFLALWIEVAYSFGALGAGLSEPFVNVERYFTEVWEVSLIGTVIFGVVMAILGVIGIILNAFGIVGAGESLAKVVIALFLPVVAWATLLAFNGTNDPAFSLHIPAPSWMSSSWIQILGTEWGFIVFPTLGMVGCVWMTFQSTLRAKQLAPQEILPNEA